MNAFFSFQDVKIQLKEIIEAHPELKERGDAFLKEKEAEPGYHFPKKSWFSFSESYD